jgi:hypothetical protein
MLTPATYGFLAMKMGGRGKRRHRPGPRRDRGACRAESDGIDADAHPAGVRRTRASRLRGLFRAAILGNPRVKTVATTKHTKATKMGEGGRGIHGRRGKFGPPVRGVEPGRLGRRWRPGRPGRRGIWSLLPPLPPVPIQPRNRSQQRERRVRPFVRTGVPSWLSPARAVCFGRPRSHRTVPPASAKTAVNPDAFPTKV